MPDGSADDGVLKRLLVSPEAATELSRIADLLEERKLWETEQSYRLAEGAVTPTADDIAEFCRRGVEAGLADYSLDSIAQRAKATREELAQWSKLVGLAECLRDLLGLREDTTPRVLRRAIEAVDLLTSIERPALLARSPSVVDEAARPVLDKAHVRLQALRERHAALRECFVVDASISLIEIRRHAGVLRTTGFFEQARR